MCYQIVTWLIRVMASSHTALDAFIVSVLGRNPVGGCRRANRLSCRFVSLVFWLPVGTCFLNHSYGYAFGPRIKYGAGSGAHWQPKSCAIITSIGEISGLVLREDDGRGSYQQRQILFALPILSPGPVSQPVTRPVPRQKQK